MILLQKVNLNCKQPKNLFLNYLIIFKFKVFNKFNVILITFLKIWHFKFINFCYYFSLIFKKKYYFNTSFSIKYLNKIKKDLIIYGILLKKILKKKIMLKMMIKKLMIKMMIKKMMIQMMIKKMILKMMIKKMMIQ